MEFFPYNINKVLLEYLLNPNTDFYKKYFILAEKYHRPDEIKIFRQDLIEFLYTKLDEKRAVIALDLIYYILRDNDQEDFLEIIRYLTKKEFTGDFHRKYRDHTTHQLLVFFLGCYLYEHIPEFKTFYHSQHEYEFADDPHPFKTGFFFQWAPISLFHDFGYFFDVDEPVAPNMKLRGEETQLINRKRQTLREFFKYIEKYFNNYLELVYTLEKGKPSEAKREVIKKFQNFLLGNLVLDYRTPIDTLVLSDLRFAKEFLDDILDGFDLLENFAKELYPKYSGILKPYFDMLNQRGGPYQEPYIRLWDHGIASALIFIKLCCYGFKVYEDIKILKPGIERIGSNLREIAQEFDSFISKWDYSKPVFDRLIVSSAFAMAFHNIRMLDEYELYDEANYEQQYVQLISNIRENIFPIRPQDNFLVYLIILVDHLQDWDRYSVVKTGDESARQTLESHQIRLMLQDNSCKFIFSGPEWVEEKAQKILQDVRKYTISDKIYIEIVYQEAQYLEGSEQG